MDYIGKHNGFETYYLDLTLEDYNDVLPENNWFEFVIANKDFDDSGSSLIDKFIRKSIDRDLLAFKGQGIFGGKLHLTIDLIIVKMEVDEKHTEIDLATTGDNKTDLANGFWECYGAPCLPDRTDYNTLKLVCTSFDGINYKDDLNLLLKRFNEGWLPPDNIET